MATTKPRPKGALEHLSSGAVSGKTFLSRCGLFGAFNAFFRPGVVRVAPTSRPREDASSATTDGQRVRVPFDDLLIPLLYSLVVPWVPCRAILGTIRSIFNQSGISGLWRGLTPTIIRNVPGTSMYFFTLNESRRVLNALWKPDGSISGPVRPDNRDNLVNLFV